MLTIRIELDVTHARRALGLAPGAPLDTLALAAALAEVRDLLLEKLTDAYPEAKLTVALRFGEYGAGRTRVRLTTGPATWRRGEAARVLAAECAEQLRDAAITEVAEINARRRGGAALDAAAAAADVRHFSPIGAAPQAVLV